MQRQRDLVEKRLWNHTDQNDILINCRMWTSHLISLHLRFSIYKMGVRDSHLNYSQNTQGHTRLLQARQFLGYISE